MTQNSQYFEFDKFIWKAEIPSLIEITGWYSDGCGKCTKSVSLQDGKLKCYANHVTAEPVPRYKLEVLAIDGKFKARFIFWDNDCAGEDNPLEFPYELDAILTKELAIRGVFHPKYGKLSVIGFKDDEESRRKIRDIFKCEKLIFVDFLVG
ncbi:hypothetical protein KIW84_051302 [Lathyrus oleraceus]|uniref:Uncharacterized protein n=1 Tax=Pisum sativum TaxID=3888 RepID=A0A9D4WKU1_PEA|nr:hypothetical protein KIW84_051302 [Pisum sativum]